MNHDTSKLRLAASLLAGPLVLPTSKPFGPVVVKSIHDGPSDLPSSSALPPPRKGEGNLVGSQNDALGERHTQTGKRQPH